MRRSGSPGWRTAGTGASPGSSGGGTEYQPTPSLSRDRNKLQTWKMKAGYVSCYVKYRRLHLIGSFSFTQFSREID